MCAYLCIRIWGLRSKPSPERRHTSLVAHRHRFCRRCFRSQPWFSCLHTWPLYKIKYSQWSSGEVLNYATEWKSFFLSSSEVLVSPDKSSLGSVGQMPSVGSEVFPANILGVVPQSAHLKVTISKSYNEKSLKRFPQLRLKLWVSSAVLTWPGVSPVCHRAFLRCSPGPVVELTTLIDRPE